MKKKASTDYRLKGLSERIPKKSTAWNDGRKTTAPGSVREWKDSRTGERELQFSAREQLLNG